LEARLAETSEQSRLALDALRSDTATRLDHAASASAASISSPSPVEQAAIAALAEKADKAAERAAEAVTAADKASVVAAEAAAAVKTLHAATAQTFTNVEKNLAFLRANVDAVKLSLSEVRVASPRLAAPRS